MKIKNEEGKKYYKVSYGGDYKWIELTDDNFLCLSSLYKLGEQKEAKGKSSIKDFVYTVEYRGEKHTVNLEDEDIGWLTWLSKKKYDGAWISDKANKLYKEVIKAL